MRAKGLLFSYPGSKWRLAPQFQRYYPIHRVFADLFGGTAAVIGRQEQHALEIYNELDPLVCNVFTVLKDAVCCAELVRLLESTSNSCDQYKLCKQVMADPSESPTRRAWAFVTCGVIGFAGHPAVVNSWTPSHKQRRELRDLPDKVIWWQNRFRNVVVKNRPWEEIVEQYDSPDTCFFADPPYLSQVLGGQANSYYRCQMDMSAHIALIERLRAIKGYVLLCGYNHPRYTEQLFHWRKVAFCARVTMNSGKKRGKRLEQVWLNYEDDGRRIEGTRLRVAQRYINIMGNADEAIKYVERVKRLKRLLT